VASAAELRDLLLHPDEASAIEVHGGIAAAVLVPLYLDRGELHAVFTRRRSDLRRHAGEISFPGGRRDAGDATLVATALREAEEEIGLSTDRVEVVGALPPVGTFVTSYKVHPFVGLIPRDLPLRPNPAEVETVLSFELEQLREGFAMRRLVRRGVPIRTPTYEVGRHLIWGATARILGEFLGRLPRD
jgi:8-oxo-dGTP pyrophosphatase MutT (NUDIX family)